MKQRRFTPYIVSNNELIDGEFIVTGRNAYCRGCGKVIPKDVKKLLQPLIHQYGYRRIFTKWSYCLKCAKKYMKVEIKECKDYIKKFEKSYKEVTQKEKIYSKQRMEMQEVIEAI